MIRTQMVHKEIFSSSAKNKIPFYYYKTTQKIVMIYKKEKIISEVKGQLILTVAHENTHKHEESVTVIFQKMVSIKHNEDMQMGS